METTKRFLVRSFFSKWIEKANYLKPAKDTILGGKRYHELGQWNPIELKIPDDKKSTKSIIYVGNMLLCILRGLHLFAFSLKFDLSHIGRSSSYKLKNANTS